MLLVIKLDPKCDMVDSYLEVQEPNNRTARES